MATPPVPIDRPGRTLPRLFNQRGTIVKTLPPNEHVSEALRHLRTGVVMCCWLISLAFLTQIMTWALVNATDLRHTTLRLPDSELPAVVVDSSGRRSVPVVKQGAAVRTHTQVQPGQGAQQDEIGQANASSSQPDPNVVLSPYDRWFAYTHQLAYALGLCAVFVLFIHATMGIGVSAASGLSGVGRLVACQSWAIILVILAVPWSSVLSDMAYPGIFSTYAVMIGETDRLAATPDHHPALTATIMYFGRYLLLPAAGIGVAWIAACSFHAGAVGGIARRRRSHLDLILDEESDGLHQPAHASSNLVSGGRASGAFRQHVGPERVDSAPRRSSTGIGLLKPGSLGMSGSRAEESSKPSRSTPSITAEDEEPVLMPDRESSTDETEPVAASGTVPRRPI